jgi:FixJ family two-component response regulator
MISGHADNQSLQQAMKYGAAALLQKPFSGADLRSAIRSAIDDSDTSSIEQPS